MRKEFILYLIAISFFSLFFSILSPLSEMIGVENKIITIDKENDDIYFTNKYGTFKVTNSDWVDRKEKVVYNDTVPYDFLFSSATDEKTVNNINKDAKLTDFEVYIGKTVLWGFMVVFFTAIFLVIVYYILYYLYKFLETFVLTLIKKKL